MRRCKIADVTAPFAPPPSRTIIAFLVALFAAMAAVPFARREDWLGWVAFATLVAANLVMWGLFLRGVWRNWREPVD
jgi:hypothetical protein